MRPTTMRAVLLRGHGGFEQLEYRADVPVPIPGAGEVLIKVGAAAINNTDINTRVGWYSKTVTSSTGAHQAVPNPEDSAWTGDALTFPRIQGADACGRIVAVGADVDAARIGERVLIDPVLRPRPGASDPVVYFGSDRDGAFAEFATVPATNACVIKSALTDVELASFPCAYSAAENMLTRAQVIAGDQVLVTGASGGVGCAAVQLAMRRGATVTAVAGRTKAAMVSTLGAARVLPRDADLVAEIGRNAMDVVVDVVGGQGFRRLLDVLRRGGRYAVAGAIAGPVVTLDLRTLYLKDLRLLGCTETAPEVFRRLIGYIELREIRALVGATYPMTEIVAAQKDFLSKSRAGKIVLIP